MAGPDPAIHAVTLLPPVSLSDAVAAWHGSPGQAGWWRRRWC